MKIILYFILLVHIQMSHAESLSFKVSPPPIPKNALRPDLERMIYPYNRGDFPRMKNMLRLDYFYDDITQNVEDLAKWAYTSMRKHNGKFTVQFHFVFDIHAKGAFKAPMPYLEKFGAKADFNGVLAKKARVKDFPSARFAYQGYVWIIPGNSVNEAAEGLLNKLNLLQK